MLAPRLAAQVAEAHCTLPSWRSRVTVVRPRGSLQYTQQAGSGHRMAARWCHALLLALATLLDAALAAESPPAGDASHWPDPPGFRWGVATSAYQIEGAIYADGRLDSIWDVSSREFRPDGRPYTSNSESGEIADGSYNRYTEDVTLMQSMGIKHYRFSIAWPRILPTGSLPINIAGVAHYNALINALIAADITPAVTLYHWDLPQALNEGDTPGWLNPDTADAFQLYAQACYDAFGDRVHTWITFNEALTFVHLGYGKSIHQPRAGNEARAARQVLAWSKSLLGPKLRHCYASHVRLSHGTLNYAAT